LAPKEYSILDTEISFLDLFVERTQLASYSPRM
jgi:hypothetical protein